PILDINHFRHFLVTLENLYPMDDEPMWVADHVVARTPEAKTWLDELNEGTIETWDELQTAFISRFFPLALFDRLLGEIRAFSQHENESLIDAWLRMKEMLQNFLNAAAGGIFLYKTPNQAYQLLEDKVLLKLNWAKNQKAKTSLKKTVAFSDEGSSNSNTDKIMARMDAMTLKMDAQYKELQNHAKKTKPDEDDIHISREEEAKFMQTLTTLMSSYTYPSIPSDYDVEDAFSSTNAPNYIPTPQAIPQSHRETSLLTL
ncbi:reverse transcriptase domain-containing protein, partial [Tanacetum coccineum]